jgi:hypothetical protein
MTFGLIRQPSFFPSYTLHLHVSKSLGQSATLYMWALTQVYGIICCNSNAISSQAGTIHRIKSALHDCYNSWRKIKYSILFYSKVKQNSSLCFRFFHIFALFFAFFRFFRFKFFASLFFAFFTLNFSLRLIFVSLRFFSLNFRLFYLRFRFRFLVFRMEVNHVKSGFFSLPSETKFSLQFQISLPKRKWGRTLGPRPRQDKTKNFKSS